MRCEECGRIIENEEMWRLGGAPGAPTSRSMLQMCWECRTKGVPAYQHQRRAAAAAKVSLNPTLIADINEAARGMGTGAA